VFGLTPELAATLNSWVMLINPWKQSAASGALCTTYAIYGKGLDVPGITESFGHAVNVTGSVLARARIHRMGVRVVNIGSTAVGSPVPDGKFYFGTLRGNVDRTAFASYNALSNFLVNRSEMKECTAYDAFTTPKVMSTSPNDWISWEQWDILGTNATTTAFADDSLNTIAIVFRPTVNTQAYDIQVDVEWTLQYTADPVMQSLHRTHAATPDSVFDEARSFVANHSGFLEEAAVAGLGTAMIGAALPEVAAGYVGRAVGTRAAARLAGMAPRAIGL